MENIYVQFGGMVYQQRVGIPMDTNCAPLIADLFLYYYERDFMSNLQKSERFDLIDKFNDTSRYIDNIFTIDNLNLLSIFLIYIQENFNWRRQILRTKQHLSWIWTLKLLVVIFTQAFTTKRGDFGFPIVNFPWLSGDVPRLPLYGI